MTKSKREEQEEREQLRHEESIDDLMKSARALAMEVFGSQCDQNAISEIADYLETTDYGELEALVWRTIDRCKSIYETTAPTSEQVFDLFERTYGEDETEE